MNVVVKNESVVVEALLLEGGLHKVWMVRSKIRGKKAAADDNIVLHFNKKKAKFTSWPKKWSAGLRSTLQCRLTQHIEAGNDTI